MLSDGESDDGDIEMKELAHDMAGRNLVVFTVLFGNVVVGKERLVELARLGGGTFSIAFDGLALIKILKKITDPKLRVVS